MHMRGALDAAGSPMKVKHLADVLDEAIHHVSPAKEIAP
jgi:hypothetical protein